MGCGVWRMEDGVCGMWYGGWGFDILNTVFKEIEVWA